MDIALDALAVWLAAIAFVMLARRLLGVLDRSGHRFVAGVRSRWGALRSASAVVWAHLVAAPAARRRRRSVFADMNDLVSGRSDGQPRPLRRALHEDVAFVWGLAADPVIDENALLGPEQGAPLPPHQRVRAVKRARLVLTSDGAVTLAGWEAGRPYDADDTALDQAGQRLLGVPVDDDGAGFHAWSGDGTLQHRRDGCLFLEHARMADHPRLVRHPLTFVKDLAFHRTLKEQWSLRAVERIEVLLGTLQRFLLLPLDVALVPARAAALVVQDAWREHSLQSAQVCIDCADALVSLSWRRWEWRVPGREPAHVVPVDLQVELSMAARFSDHYRSARQRVLRVEVPARFLEAHRLDLDEVSDLLGGVEVVVADNAEGRHRGEFWDVVGTHPYGRLHVVGTRDALRRLRAYRSLRRDVPPGTARPLASSLSA